jgi:hypothetical protein
LDYYVGTGTLVVEALVEVADTAGECLLPKGHKGCCKASRKSVSISDAMAYYSLFPPYLFSW